MITAPGLFHDIASADYHADPAPAPSLSRGLAATLLTKSPLHAYREHPKLGGIAGVDDPTKEMDFGSLGHRLLLGKGDDVQVGEWDDWRTNAAKEWRTQMRKIGHLPVLQKTYERALALEDGAKSELQRLGIADDFASGKSEVVALWQEEGHWLRAMFDRLVMSEDRATIYDLKITESAHPDACARQISNMMYDLQDAHYLRAITKLYPHLAGRARFVFLFVENDAPFSVTPMELSGEWKMLSERMWARAFAKWKECRTSNVWPTYADKILRAEPPAWKVNAELKREYENQ